MTANFSNNNGMGNKTSSTDLITNGTAFYGALYVAPFVYHATYQFAEKMLVEHYGEEFVTPILFGHWVFCFCISFLGIRGALAKSHRFNCITDLVCLLEAASNRLRVFMGKILSDLSSAPTSN